MFAIQVWNSEAERFDNYAEGYACAKAANALVDKLMSRGFFARVVTTED